MFQFGDITSITTAEIYVSPHGHDVNNDGLSQFSPKLTGYAGAQALAALGGGTLWLEDGWTWGGPVANQGLWFRNDALPVPGFLPITNGIRIRALPKSSGILFQNSTLAYGTVGGQTRKTPGLWVCATTTAFDMEGVGFLPYVACPFRIGWDYDRLANGGIREITVTNANRAAGSTVLTVTLPAGDAITSATRVGTVVTATVTLAVPSPYWRVGQVVKITSTDPNFPSGDFTLTGTPSFSTFTYTQAGAATTGTNIGTVQSHGCSPGEYLDLFSTDAEFPEAPYNVTAATSTTITVTDPLGYAPRTATISKNNIGTLAHENRALYSTSATRIAYGASQMPAVFASGPFFDIGACAASSVLLENCFCQGVQGAYNGAHYIKQQGAGVFLNAGQTGTGAGVIVENMCSSDAGVYLDCGPSTTDAVTINRWLADTGSGFAPPMVAVKNANLFMSLDVDEANTADSSVTINSVTIESGTIDPRRIRFGTVSTLAGGSINAPGMLTAPIPPQVPSYSPWTRGQIAAWGAPVLQIAGSHPAVNRAMGPTAARFQNLAAAASAWSVTGGWSLSTVGAPDGSTTATRITAASAGTGTLSAIPFSMGSAVGGRHVLAGWIQLQNTNDFVANTLVLASQLGNITYVGGAATLVAIGHSAIPGWIWIKAEAEIATSAGNPTNMLVTASVKTGTTLDVWGLTVIYVPPAVLDDDFHEWFGTMKHQPNYLAPGMTGTMDGQKFIAHGGLGVKSTLVVVAAPGAIDRYLMLYDENGNAIMRINGSAP